MANTLLIVTTLGAILLAYSATNIWSASNQTQTLVGFGGPVFSAWSQWKISQNKNYLSSTQENYRFQNFSSNYNIVQVSNNNPKNTFTLELNKYADLSQEEFQATYLTHKTEFKTTSEEGFTQLSADSTIPDSKDWVKDTAVTRIKDQGQCGSCWAFSAVGSLEGLHRISGGLLQDFAAQQMVDCARGQLFPFEGPNMGCKGGNMGFALQYSAHHGMELDCAYTYVARQEKCDYREKQANYKNGGHKNVTKNCSSCLKAQVAQQPVSVAINGSAIQLYKSGVFNGDCSAQTNHGVVAVGYGNDSTGGDFWKVKNSWGEKWGESGFFRMARTDAKGEGLCGIATQPVYPTK